MDKQNVKTEDPAITLRIDCGLLESTLPVKKKKKKFTNKSARAELKIDSCNIETNKTVYLYERQKRDRKGILHAINKLHIFCLKAKSKDFKRYKMILNKSDKIEFCVKYK